MPTDAELYDRGAATLLASWEAYARATPGAEVQRLPGVAVAVFPQEPERPIYNNALLERGGAIDAMEAAYAGAGVTRFSAWVHETDLALQAALERRGYTLDTSTRAMGMALGDLTAPRPELDLARPTWDEHLRIAEVPPALLAGIDADPFHVLVARRDGESVATALAFDLDSDCGIYNVGTLEHARRRGVGTALTALQLHDARARGCETASLQSSAMAEGVYRALGLRDLGLILEYVPPS